MAPDIELLETLKRHGVPFVTVGGHAVNFHGYRRATEDVDVVWLRTPENEVLLLAALTEVGASYIGKEIDPKTGIERMYPVTLPYIQANRLLMLWTRCGFFDLFDYIPGYPDVDAQELFSTSIDADGIRYCSLDWLRKMKKAAARTKDLLDLENLPE